MNSLPRRKKCGLISFQRPDKMVKKKWKSYRFEVNSMYFLYCKTGNIHNPDGMVLLGSITKLETDPVKDTTFPLQVHFREKSKKNGSPSPWVLDFMTSEDRIEWMECLKPGSSKDLLRFYQPIAQKQELVQSLSRSLSLTNSLQQSSESSLTSPSGTDMYDTPMAPQEYLPPVHMVSDADRYAEAPAVPPRPPQWRVPRTRTQSSVYPTNSTSQDNSFLSNTCPLPDSERHLPKCSLSHEQPSVLHRGIHIKEETRPLKGQESQANHQNNDKMSYGKSTINSRSLFQNGKNTGMNGRPTAPQEYLQLVPTDDDAEARYVEAPAVPPQHPQQRAPKREQGNHDSTGQDNSFLSKLSDICPLPTSEKHLPKCSLSHEQYDKMSYGKSSTLNSRSSFQDKGSTTEDTSCNKEGEFDSDGKEGEFDHYDVPKNLARSSTNDRPPITPRKKTSAANSVENDYELMHEYEVLPEIQNDADNARKCPTNFVPTIIPRKKKNATNSAFREYDNLLYEDVLPNGQNFAGNDTSTGRGPTNFRPTVTPRKKKAAANSTFSQDYYDENYVDMQCGREQLNATKPLPVDKLLVTEEDDEECYEPRPQWAKVMGQDAASKKRQQLSSDCEALKDLDMEALYIAHSSISDLHKIGEGQFGEVFKAEMQRGWLASITVAVKTSKNSQSAKQKAEFLREMNIMSTLQHPNIVKLHGIIQDDVPAPWIVVEFMKNGDLKQFLTKNRKPLERLVKYMLDIAMGMHYLSEKGLIHRDLAARNVLVSEDETCKVSDFGLMRELPEDDSMYHMSTFLPCPVRWMAPESIGNKVFSPASDVWSFGVLQWEMFHPSELPYHDMSNLAVAAKVTTGERLKVPLHCPYVLARIMKACWHKVPEKRPSFLLIIRLLNSKV